MASIRTKFIALTLSGIVLTSTVIGGMGIMSTARFEEEHSGHTMNLFCAEKAQMLDGVLSRVEQAANLLASHVLRRLESVDRLASDPRYLAYFTDEISASALNAATFTEGSLASFVRFNPEILPPTAGVYWHRDAKSGIMERIATTDLSRFSPEDTQRVGWYHQPAKLGRAMWIEPYFNPHSGTDIITYVVPLYADGRLLGVAGLDVEFSLLTDSVEGLRLENQGYAYLTDGDANIMFHPDLKRGTPLPHENALGPAIEEFGGDTGMALFPYVWEGVEKRQAWRTLRNDMRLVFTAPAKALDRKKGELLWKMGLAMTVFTAFSGLLAYLLTRYLTEPLRELNEAVRRIMAGDLAVRISPRSRDEIGSVAAAFQQTIEQLKSYVDNISGLAYRDALTGVRNKTAFLEFQNRMQDRMEEEPVQFGIMMLDLNGLKRVNDTLGHEAGDKLITRASRIICRVFKHSPVYRIGGDEFVVILENDDFASLPQLEQAFHAAVLEQNALLPPAHHVSIAYGIAIYDKAQDDGFTAVFKRADKAMYERKAAMKAGRSAS